MATYYTKSLLYYDQGFNLIKYFDMLLLLTETRVFSQNSGSMHGDIHNPNIYLEEILFISIYEFVNFTHPVLIIPALKG